MWDSVVSWMKVAVDFIATEEAVPAATPSPSTRRKVGQCMVWRSSEQASWLLLYSFYRVNACSRGEPLAGNSALQPLMHAQLRLLHHVMQFKCSNSTIIMLFGWAHIKFKAELLHQLRLHSILHAIILASSCFALLVYILSTSSLSLWCGGSWLTLWGSPAHKACVSTWRTIVQWEGLTGLAKWGLPLSPWWIREYQFQVMTLPYSSRYPNYSLKYFMCTYTCGVVIYQR